MPVALGVANSPVFLNNGVGSGGVTPPNAPTNLVAVQNGSDVDLTWTDNSTDEDGFKIYRSSDNIIFAEIDDIAAGSTAYTDLNPGSGVWYYYVAAYNAGGESDSNVANAFIGALDAIPNLVHLYDIARRWVSSYTGDLVRLRRNSDNAELDFSYVANGDLDVVAINTWLGGASGFIVTIYDQILGDNVTQATAGNQPLFVASGQGARAVGRYNGTSQFLQGAFTNGGALSQPFNSYAVGQLGPGLEDNNVSYAIVDGDDSGGRMQVYKNGTITPRAINIYAGTNLVSPNAATGNFNLYSSFFNGASSQFWTNGTSQVVGNAGTSNADGITIGARFNATAFWWDGDIATIAIADPNNNTANRQAVEAALADYWSIP